MDRPFIILVDDDPDKRLLLERFFRRNFPEIRVHSVVNCASAFPLVESPFPKIVVTNGRIAQEDGIKFASFVVREAKAPVVMVSLRHQLKQKALEAGVSDFIETGENEELLAAIRRALDQISDEQNRDSASPSNSRQNEQ